MKKILKLLLISIVAFVFTTLTTNAKTITYDEFLKELDYYDSDIKGVYIIGKYAFTDINPLTTQDIMMASRSIESQTLGGTKNDAIFTKMVISYMSRKRTGMTYSDWTIEKPLVGTGGISKNQTLDIDYIDYQPVKNIYTVIFKDTQGTEIDRQYVIEGEYASFPQMAGIDKDAINWYQCTSDSNCSNVENSEDVFNLENEKITSDITLMAKYKKFNVTFDKDSSEGNAISNQVIEYGKKATEPSKPTKTGYEFLGWFKCTNKDNCDNIANEQTAFDFTNTLVKEDITLKAKWEQIKYTITFKGMIDGKPNDKLIDKKEQTVTYPYKLNLNEIPKTEQEGYSFDGCYRESNNSQVTLNEHLSFNADTTIVCKWKTKEYTVTYKDYEKKDYRILTVKYDNLVEKVDDLERPSNTPYNGYEFKGWFMCKDDDCNDIETLAFDFNETTVKNNLTLIAKYDPVVYTNDIIDDFVDNLQSADFSTYINEEKIITFNILHKDTDLQTNFNKFISEMKNIMEVTNVNKVTIGYNGKTEDLKLNTMETQLKDMLAALSKKSFESSHISDLVNATFTIKLTLENGYKNSDSKEEDIYTVNFDTDNFVYVRNEEELNANLSGTREIIIYNDFDIEKPINISKDIVIDGNGKTLTSKINNSKYMVNITSGKAVIKNLTLKINTLKPSEYDKNTKASIVGVKNTIGIYVGEDAHLMATGVNVTSDVTINRDNLTIAGEKLNSTSVVLNENAAIELHGTLEGSALTYTNEIYGSPAVLATKTATMNLGKLHHQKYVYNVKRTNKLTDSCDSIENIDKFVHYYGDYNNSYITFAWYSPDNGNKIYFTYIYKEHLILPEIFKENGKYNTYSKDGKNYVLDHWSIRYDSDNLSNDALMQKQVLNNEIIYIYAKYVEKN